MHGNVQTGTHGMLSSEGEKEDIIQTTLKVSVEGT